MTHPAFLQGFFGELEKIAREKREQPSTTDRVLKAAPGMAGVAGGVAGAAAPNAFNPEAFFPKIKAKSSQGRAVSGLLGAGTAATTAWLPGAARDSYKALLTKEGAENDGSPDMIEDENGDPSVKIIGASIEKLDEKRARGVPIVPPPPGFTYDPELGGFAPDSNDPGWLTEPEAMQARENAFAFQQGSQQQAQAGAQQEAQNAAQKAVAAQQQYAAAQAGQAAPAAPQAPSVPVPPTPGSIAGDHPMAQGQKKPQVARPKAQRPNSTNSIAR
jgi:hypothetical protein